MDGTNMIFSSHKGVARAKYRLKDYLYHPTFGTTIDALPGLPSDGLGRVPLVIKDQGVSNFCTAFGISSQKEYTSNVQMSPEYQTALEGELNGSPIFSGADPDLAMASGLKGILPQTSSPYTFQTNGWTDPAYFVNYDQSLAGVASQFKEESYYSLTHPLSVSSDFDTFDSIRIGLWDSKTEVVIAFGWWYQEWNVLGGDGIVQMPTNPVTRHCYLFIDFKVINGVEYLVAQLSSGKKLGDNGLLYFPREVVNYAWKNPYWNGLRLYIYRDKGETITTGFDLEAFLADAVGRFISFFREL